MLLMLTGRAPVLVKVTDFARLLLTVSWVAKLRLVFESATIGACSRTPSVPPQAGTPATSSLPSLLKSPTVTAPVTHPKSAKVYRRPERAVAAAKENANGSGAKGPYD